MKDSKRRKEPGRNSFEGLGESGNEEVCREALPGRPNQKGLEECSNIVPSHAAGVNNQDVFIFRPPFSASSGQTKTGWQKNGGQKMKADESALDRLQIARQDFREFGH